MSKKSERLIYEALFPPEQGFNPFAERTPAQEIRVRRAAESVQGMAERLETIRDIGRALERDNYPSRIEHLRAEHLQPGDMEVTHE